MEYEEVRKQKKDQEIQKIELKLKKYGLDKKLAPESIDAWVNYYRTHSHLSKAIMKSKIRDEKKIKELCLKHKLGHEKLLEWVLFYQKYSSFVPIGFIEEQIQRGKDISLENVIKNNKARSKSITEFAVDLGYSLESSERWGEICAKMPHIRSDVIKNRMKEEKEYTRDKAEKEYTPDKAEKKYTLDKAEKKYTPDDFKIMICKYEIINAILHSLDKCSKLRSYDGCNIHKIDLYQQDEQLGASGDVSYSEM